MRILYLDYDMQFTDQTTVNLYNDIAELLLNLLPHVARTTNPTSYGKLVPESKMYVEIDEMKGEYIFNFFFNNLSFQIQKPRERE